MLSLRSFIDVLFILLLGTMVLLTQSVQIGAVETELLRLGGGAVSSLRETAVDVVVVADDGVQALGRRWERVDELARSIDRSKIIVLVVANRQVSHHRVMAVWSAFRSAGLTVRLGAEPSSDAPDRAEQER